MAFHSSYEDKAPPCLLRGSLAYIFSGLLIWMQHVKRVCGKQKGVFEPKFLVYREKIKGSETFFRLIFPKKSLILLEINTPVFH